MPSGILDELGVLEGTDKGSISHGYLRHYECALRHLRDKPITLLEIGVAAGSSLRMWATYFQRATIIGVDVNGAAMQHAGERRIVEIGSQGDPDFLAGLAAKYSPDVIVDDGSHRADHILLTFQILYPTLRPGGIYIVEDVDFHAGPWAQEYRGSADTSPQAYFLTLASATVCPQERRPSDPMPGADAVEFFRGAIVVKKAPAPEAVLLARYVELVERSGLPHMWSMLSGYALNNGRPQDAVAYARRAVELGSDSLGTHRSLAEALEKTGDLEGAIEAMHEAVRLHPNVAPFVAHLRDLEGRR